MITLFIWNLLLFTMLAFSLLSTFCVLITGHACIMFCLWHNLIGLVSLIFVVYFFLLPEENDLASR